jgi:hypothetical protein
LVAQVGSAGGNGNIYELYDPVINAAGQTAFGVVTEDLTFRQSFGIWSESSGPLRPVAQTDDPAPGATDGALFDYFGNYSAPGFDPYPVMNASGHVAFVAFVKGNGVTNSNSYGIWTDASGPLSLVVRAGDPTPGVPGNASFGGFSLPLINSLGQVAFASGWTNWSDSSGSLALIAKAGDPAPGTSSSFITLDPPTLNSAGQMAFTGFLGTSPGDFSDVSGSGVWSNRTGSLALAYGPGTQAPGTPAGDTFSGGYGGVFYVMLNSAARMVFLAGLTGPGIIKGSNDGGLWSEGFGQLALVAREGDHAPGTPAGVLFSNLNRPTLNSAGQTAFIGQLAGNGIDSTNNQGIWAQDRTGQLQLIARYGDSIEVAPGDFRTISTLSFYVGNSDEGTRSGFNSHGQLAFQATFTDGTSGIFVSSLAAVPEPQSLLLMFAAAVPLVVLRWRQRSFTPSPLPPSETHPPGGPGRPAR